MIYKKCIINNMTIPNVRNLCVKTNNHHIRKYAKLYSVSFSYIWPYFYYPNTITVYGDKD